MEALTGDLIVEILSRLPVKSIVRARCVSKSWNKLISDDCRQRKRLPPAMAGIIFKHRYIKHSGVWFVKTRDTSCYDGESPVADPDFGSVSLFHTPPKIVSVCNGLALCICYPGTAQYAVCNPATGRWRSLRRPDCKDFRLLAIGFHPRLSRHYRVLGYYQENSAYKFKMFLSETDEWADCARNYQPDPTMKQYISMRCVSHNGIFHIIHVLYRGALHPINEVRKRIEIFAVDVEENNCRRVELPYHAPPTWSQTRLGVSDGLLHLAMRSGDEMLVWAMEDYNNNQWVLKHARSFASTSLRFTFLNGYTLSHFHPDMSAIFILLEEAIVSYNFATGNLGAIYRTHGSNYHPFSPCFSSNDV